MQQLMVNGSQINNPILNTASPEIEAMYVRDARAIFRHCQSILGDINEAEDALQETFIKAYRCFKKSPDSTASQTWMRRIATNVCINMLRTQSRKGWISKENIEPLAKDHSDPIQKITARQTLNHLLKMLNEVDLQIVIGHYFEGMRQGEIAKSIGISRRAVVKRLTKIRTRLDKANPAKDSGSYPVCHLVLC